MKHFYKIKVLIISLYVSQTFAQVGNKTSLPTESAVLEIASTSKGFLPPRMTNEQKLAIANPVAGLKVWCTDCGLYGEAQVYNGYTWKNSIGGTASTTLNLTPVTIVVSPSDSKILVQWSAIINSISYIIEYRVMNTSTWNSFTVLPNQTGFEIMNLTNGTQYEIQVKWITSLGNTIPSAIKTATPSASSTTALNNHILISGQSLSLGVSGGTALTTTQPYNNMMLQLQPGVALNGNNTTFTDATYIGLIPLKEPNTNAHAGTEETPASAMGNMISALAAPNSFNTIISLHGIGGKSYAELKKGGTLASYANGQLQAKRAMSFSLASEKGYKIRAAAIIHGERDQALSTPIATYEANLVEWQANYEQDAKLLTGQSEGVPMFINQNSSWTGYNMPTPTIAIAQLNAIRNNPNKIYITTPYYIFDYVDHAHIKKWGYRRSGEYFGKIMKKVLVDNEDWKPVMPIQVVRSGNTIEAKFHVPVAPLVFDTNAVVSKTNYGFEYYDATSSASISSVAIIGGDIVRITLNQTPTGSSQLLRYAYTGVNGNKGSRTNLAPSGNLRDSDTTPALYVDANIPSWAGTTLPNWSVTFNDPIVAAPSQPQNISGVVTNGQISLSWDAPISNGGAAISDYSIEYKTMSSNTWTVFNDGISTNTNAVVNNITNGTTYNVRISAVNANAVKGLIGTATF